MTTTTPTPKLRLVSTTPSTPRRCACGHPADMHTHYRPGSDCGLCGKALCPTFTAEGQR